MDLTSISLLRRRLFFFFLLSSHLLLFSSSSPPLLFASDSSNNNTSNKDELSSSTQKQCVYDHFSALLHLKQGFDFSYVIRYTTLSSWNPDNRDCCSWEGITCDGSTGQVTHLDLGSLRISGQIDSQSISRLWSLRRLDLSFNFFRKITSIGPLVKNLTSLRELHLDQVNISAEGREWGEALSSLHHLRKLSLADCGLSGPIHSSLSQLHYLTKLHLSYNNLSCVVPDFIGNFSSLTSLGLDNCGLHGRFPNTIVKLPSLKNLYVSSNPSIRLSEFPQNSSLQQLHLSINVISGKLLDSLSNLKFLTVLILYSCNLVGPLPLLANLTRLEYLDLSSNSFSGPIPSSYGKELLNLKNIRLSHNLLSGTIPSSLFSLPLLLVLNLQWNQLGGQLGEFHNASHSQLEEIYLDHNSLMGMIPRSIFKFKKLEEISFAFNNFSGDVDLGLVINLKNLTSLYLSNNNLSVKDSSGNSTSISLPRLAHVYLRSCNISEFPSFLRNQESLKQIDLSNNRISGEIPQWIWKVGNGSLQWLDLSDNLLHGIEPLIPLTNLEFLDLSCNLIKGSIPIPLYPIYFFSLSNNSFTGEIHESICNATSFEILDLSDNHLSGWIPPCLGEMSRLVVLNLRGNDFHGTLLQTFQKGCSLETIDLSGNRLGGKIPRSLSNCKQLEVLNLGNNHLRDTFPSWLGELSKLRVLVLRSNQFHGPIGYLLTNNTLPLLQIIDLSSNNFTGSLPSNIFRSWKAMMEVDDSQYMFLNKSIAVEVYYQDKLTLVSKGLEMELVKILAAFTVVDFSNNEFQGNIPESIGDLKSLHVLNMSHNHFTGQIPTSFENIRALESLDLSHNKLSGKIPMQLTVLTFLEVLDISQNLLVGIIPQSHQFLTFPKESFVGNLGLCGPPLPKKCEDGVASLPLAPSESTYDWEFIWIGFGVGYGVGLGILLWTLVLWTKGRREFYVIIDRMLC